MCRNKFKRLANLWRRLPRTWRPQQEITSRSKQVGNANADTETPLVYWISRPLTSTLVHAPHSSETCLRETTTRICFESPTSDCFGFTSGWKKALDDKITTISDRERSVGGNRPFNFVCSTDNYLVVQSLTDGWMNEWKNGNGGFIFSLTLSRGQSDGKCALKNCNSKGITNTTKAKK